VLRRGVEMDRRGQRRAARRVARRILRGNLLGPPDGGSDSSNEEEENIGDQPVGAGSVEMNPLVFHIQLIICPFSFLKKRGHISLSCDQTLHFNVCVVDNLSSVVFFYIDFIL